MAKPTRTIQYSDTVTLPIKDAKNVAYCSTGETARLYLYIKANDDVFKEDEAMEALCLDEYELMGAVDELRELGLLDEPQDQIIAPMPALQMSYRESMSVLKAEVQQVLDRRIRKSDENALSQMLVDLHLQAETIILILHYCEEQYEVAHNCAAMPDLTIVTDKAKQWVLLGIHTYEQAETWIGKVERQSEGLRKVKEALGYDGEPPKECSEFITSWIVEMGINPDVVILAIHRANVHGQSKNWRYIDSIIHQWDGKGYKTPDAVKRNDPERTRAIREQPAQEAPDKKEFPEPSNADIERLLRLSDRIKRLQDEEKKGNKQCENLPEK